MRSCRSAAGGSNSAVERLEEVYPNLTSSPVRIRPSGAPRSTFSFLILRTQWGLFKGMECDPCRDPKTLRATNEARSPTDDTHLSPHPNHWADPGPILASYGVGESPWVASCIAVRQLPGLSLGWAGPPVSTGGQDHGHSSRHTRGAPMGWEKGRYYTRTKRVDGKVVREYFGCGPEAERAAQKDVEARDRRRNQQLEEQIERDTCDALDAPFEELDWFCAVAVEAFYINAGYKRHNRGEWRKPRIRIGRFKPPVSVPRTSPQKPMPAPSPRSTPATDPHPHSPSGAGVVPIVADTQTGETPVPREESSPTLLPTCQSAEAPPEDNSPSPIRIDLSQRSQSHAKENPPEDNGHLLIGVPVTAEECLQPSPPASDGPDAPSGPVARSDSVGEGGDIPQARPSNTAPSQKTQSAQSARAGQRRTCHIINSNECFRMSGVSPGPAEGASYRGGSYPAGAGGEFASQFIPLLGRGLHRQGAGGPPGMSQWLSAAPPPAATMRIPIDP